MRVFIIAACAIVAAACAERAPGSETPSESAIDGESSPAPDIINIADDFVTIFDATEGLPTGERVAAFKRDVAAELPAFYGVERYEGRVTQERQDERIAKAIESFPEIRERYIKKAARFAADLGENIETFEAAFPDFKLEIPVVLLHSLGEMDGGPREFDGKVYLIFGADGMVRYHSWEDESAFFHHELFHIHHQAAFEGCEEVWCTLWLEGLAVYVAEQLNPEAARPQLLLDFPEGLVADTQVRLTESLAHLKSVLRSTDRDVLSELFTPNAAATDLPPRRGYYLGYLVAKEIGEGRDLESLATLSNDEARPLINSAIDMLIARNAER